MKTGKDLSFHMLFLFILVASILHISLAADTIDPTLFIRDGDTIVSRGEKFELGFFSLPKSANRYVGIWYHGIPVLTPIWVANSQHPLKNDTSGVLKLIRSGELVIQDKSNTTIWSSNTSTILQNPFAQLLDSGNLVIRESFSDNNAENYFWQSFDDRCNTVSQAMELGWNLVTGTERYMQSWSSDDDPSPGEYSIHMDISGYPQMVIKRGKVVQSRIGPWNGIAFSGTGLTPNPNFFPQLLMNSTSVYLKVENSDTSVISRFTLSPSGVAQHSTWINRTATWKADNNFPADICDTYGYCGAHGSCNIFNTTKTCRCLDRFVPRYAAGWDKSDWSSGCVRRTRLNCSDDVFIGYKGIKMPDSRTTRFNETLTLNECERVCLGNCSCRAYSNLDVRNGGSGCLLWFGDLVDIRQLVGEEQQIYIRLASSESDKGNNGSKAKSLIMILISVVGVGVIIIGLILLLSIYKRKRRRRRRRRRRKENAEEKDLELPIFDLSTIIKATNDFSMRNKIGQGGFGPVYKGVLEDGKEIAVKRLSETSSQGLVELKNEVIFIAKLQHRNLVKLLGCCLQRDEKMLVYEYMPNKSLDLILFDREKSKLLDWPKRFNIINDIARGILYLHQDSRLRIIHRDLKAGNVLLDSNMNAKISDFGLAKSVGGDQTEGNTSRVVGTYGYMSPEYAADGLFSTKSDVYSFGVLILEIVTGQRNRGFHHEDHQRNLLGHAWILHREGRSIELIDPNLEDSVYISQVLRSIHVALLCVQQNLEDRPNMSSVVLMLVGESALPEAKQPGFFAARDVLGVENTSSTNQASKSNNELTISTLDGR